MKYKIRSKSRLVLFLAVALVVLAAGFAGACGEQNGDEPGTVKEITVALFADFSGPAAASAQASAIGIRAMFRYLNNAELGIDVGNGNRVTVNFVERDHKYDMATATSLYREIVQTDKPDLIFWYVELTIGGIESELATNKTPVIHAAAMDPNIYYPEGWSFCMRSDIDIMGGFYKWVLEDWDGTDRPKVGALIMNNAWGYGKRTTYDWADQNGIDIVERTYEWNSLDFTPQLLAFKAEGVDYVYADVQQAQAALVIRDARASGMMTDTTFVIGPNFRSDALLGITQDVEGFYMTCYDNPDSTWTEGGLEIYRNACDWAGVQPKPDARSEFGIYMITKNVVKRAVEQAGFENLDGEAIYNALDTYGELDTMGWMPMSFGPSKRVGPDATKVCAITTEGLDPVTEWIDTPRLVEAAHAS